MYFPVVSAIYLLLMVSLVGCLWPRGQHLKTLRQPPARTPRNLKRLPEYGQLVLETNGPTPDDPGGCRKDFEKMTTEPTVMVRWC